MNLFLNTSVRGGPKFLRGGPPFCCGSRLLWTLCSLLFLGCVVSGQEATGSQTLGDDPEQRFGPDLWERMQATDAERDPWSEELLGQAMGETLDQLRDRLEGVPGAAALAEDFVLRLPDLAQSTLLRDDDSFRVRQFPMGLESEPGTAALDVLGKRLGESGSRHVKWKVIGVQRVEDQSASFSLELIYHAHGDRLDSKGERRLLEQQARASLRGSIDPAGVPRATGLSFGDMTEIEGPRQGGSLLVDATRSAFSGDPQFEAQFGPGMNELRRQNVRSLGLPLLGHPAGIATGDVNGDLLEDLYLCQPGGLPNRLFLANGDGTFRAGNAGEAALLDGSISALLIELDGDGDVDLVASVLDELMFFSNDGSGQFRFEASAPGGGTTSLAAADIDQDGDLDIFAANYSSPYNGDSFPVPYQDAINGAPNRLYMNFGNWNFSDVASDVGFNEAAARFSFAASWEDFDGDGDPDLYVANDFGRNELWRNDLLEEQPIEGLLVRRRRFHNVAAEMGVEDLSAGMGVSWGDVDGDGAPDLYVSNMYSAAGNRIAFQRSFQEGADEETREQFQRHASGNSLFLNRVAEGQGFVDVSEASGTTMGRWAWGSIHVDLDMDGRLDLVVPNGFLTSSRTDDL